MEVKGGARGGGDDEVGRPGAAAGHERVDVGGPLTRGSVDLEKS